MSVTGTYGTTTPPTATPRSGFAERGRTICVDVSDIPKRRLTVFTGVSGSGKCSLVFGTIAAESQRLINETYSAFVQGFMPSPAGPTWTCWKRERGDHRRPGADGSQLPIHRGHRHRRTRPAADRVQPAREPVGRPCLPLQLQHRPAPVPTCEGRGSVTDIDLEELFDADKSLNGGAITVPGYTPDGWTVRVFSESGLLDGDKAIRDYTADERQTSSTPSRIKVKIATINMTYEGLVPRVRKSFLTKDKESLQPHLRAFVGPGRHLHRLPGVRRRPAEPGCAGVPDRRMNIADAARHADQ